MTTAMSSDASNNEDGEEYSLVPRSGSGKKQAFNNKEARLVGSGVNKGGWVVVELKDGRKQIKWRNRAWEQKDTQGHDVIATFSTLTDDCLVRIFSFLGAGQHEAATSEEEWSVDYTDDYLAKDLPPENVNIKLSLEDAVELHKSIALISKRFDSL